MSMPQDTSWSTAIPVCSPPGRQNGGGDHKYSAACAAHVATESRQGDQQALLQPARITLTQYTSEHRHCTDQSAEQAKAGGTVHTQPAVAVGQWHSHAKENSSKLKPPKPKGKSHINKKTSAHSLKDKALIWSIEAKLAEATANLHELQQQNQLLQAKNALLQQSARKDGVAENTMTFSVWGQPRSVILSQVRELTPAQLCALWAEYMQEIATCLLQLAKHLDERVTQRMNQLTSEAINIVGLRTRIDGTMSAPGISFGTTEGNSSPIDEGFYKRVLNGIWALTEAQAQDLMHLRRLYITRRCVLSMQRKSLMKQIADTDSQLLSPSPTVIRVEKLTEALHENSAEDYEVFYKIARAMYRGVLTLRQVAEMFVHAFPHCVENTETLLEDLAVQRQEPTKQDIIAAAANCPMTTEWAAIVQYWRMLQHSHCRDHQPIPRC